MDSRAVALVQPVALSWHMVLLVILTFAGILDWKRTGQKAESSFVSSPYGLAPPPGRAEAVIPQKRSRPSALAKTLELC